MPVTLNTFKNAVRNANADSFIRMSGSRPGEIVNYGTTLLFRKLGWYRHGTTVQNRQVREQLFAALQGEGENVQEQTLARIRRDLGIDDQGHSSVTTQLTAREIRQILDKVASDNANAQARRAFAGELQGKFPSQLQEKISELLGLENPETMLQPLTEEDKAAIRHELQNKGIEAFNTVCTSMKLPDIQTLEKLPLAATQITCFKEMLLEGSTTGQFSEDSLRVIKANVNDAMVMAQKEQAEGKLLQAFDRLKAETGVDVTALKDVLLKKVMIDVCLVVNSNAYVVSDSDAISKLIDSTIETVASRRKALITGIQNAKPKLDPTMEAGLLKLAATDVSLKNASVALCLPEFVSTFNDLLEYAGSPNPSKEAFAKKLHAWDASFNAAVKTCKARLGNDFGADDSYSLNQWMTNLSLFCFEKKHGKGPEMDATLVQFIKQLRADCDYMSEHPEDGADLSKPYAYSENYAQMEGATHFSRLTSSVGGIFNIDLTQDKLPPSNGLSQESAEFMAMEDGMTKRYPDPYGKVIDQKLGSLFNDYFMKALQSNEGRSTNETLTDYPQMFAPVVRDLERCGIGLKLGDTVIAYPGKAGMEEDALEKIKAYFDQDATLGLNAARVLSGILNQTIPNHCLGALKQSGEGGGMALSQDYAITLNVTRRADGDYVIDFKYDTIADKHIDRQENHVQLDQSQSHLTIASKLLLTVDERDKCALLRMDSQGSKLHAEFHKSKFTEKEYERIFSLKEPNTNAYLKDQILSCPGLDGDAHLKELLNLPKLNQQAIFDYLKDKIITEADKDALVALGMSVMQIRHLSMGLLPGTRLTKELVQRLTGEDPGVRQAAFEELKGLCQRLVEVGWHGPAELVDVNDQTLATVGGLKANSKDTEIVRAFIHASEDEGIRNIPYVLATGDKAAVNEAKTRLAAIIPQARRALGVDLLKTLHGRFSSEDIQMLKTAPDQERVKRYLEAIVLKNAEMELAIPALGTYVQSLKIMNQSNLNA